MKDNKNIRMIPESVEVNFNTVVDFFVVVVDTTSVSTSLSSFNVKIVNCSATSPDITSSVGSLATKSEEM